MASLAHDPDARVLLEHRGAVGVLVLNRPEKLNAADLAMQRLLLERWRQLGADEGVRAVVLTGAGRAFCAGGDVELLQDAQRPVRDELSRIHRELLPLMLQCPVPTLAAVHGPAVGFGAELAALCDLVVMDENAYLSDPHVRYGLPASPGCQLVWPHLTSRAVAKELMLSGRQVNADEALRLGLANRVTAPGDDVRVALELAAELAAMPAAGVAEIKRASNAPLLDELTRLELRSAW
jgi:enoyl-CoA hydratase